MSIPKPRGLHPKGCAVCLCCPGDAPMSWCLVPCLGIGIEPWSSRTVCRIPGLCVCSINLNSGHLHEGREPSQVQDVPAGPMEMSLFPGTLTAALARVHPLCFVQSLQSCSAATTSAQGRLQVPSPKLGCFTALRVGRGVTVPAGDRHLGSPTNHWCLPSA